MNKGKVIFDDDGQVLCHRVWFKILLNPILRRFGHCIVTCLDKDNKVTGYQFRRYPLWSLGKEMPAEWGKLE